MFIVFVSPVHCKVKVIYWYYVEKSVKLAAILLIVKLLVPGVNTLSAG